MTPHPETRHRRRRLALGLLLTALAGLQPALAVRVNGDPNLQNSAPPGGTGVYQRNDANTRVLYISGHGFAYVNSRLRIHSGNGTVDLGKLPGATPVRYTLGSPRDGLDSVAEMWVLAPAGQ